MMSIWLVNSFQVHPTFLFTTVVGGFEDVSLGAVGFPALPCGALHVLVAVSIARITRVRKGTTVLISTTANR